MIRLLVGISIIISYLTFFNFICAFFQAIFAFVLAASSTSLEVENTADSNAYISSSDGKSCI